MEQFI